MARVLVVTRSASVLGKAPAIATALHDAGFEVILALHEHPTPRAGSEPERPVVGGQDSVTVLEPVGVLAALEAARGHPQGGPAWQARIEDPGGQQRTEVAQFVVICQDAFSQAAAPLPFRFITPEAVRGKRVLVVGDGSDAWDTACAIALLNEGRGVQLRTPAPAATTAAPQPGPGTAAGAGPAPPVHGSMLLDEARRRALQAALQPHYTAAAPGAVGRVLRGPTKRRFWTYVKGRAERAVRRTESGSEGGTAAEPPLPSAAAAAVVPAPTDHFTGPGGAPGSSAPDPPVVTVWAPSLRDPRVMPFLSPQLRETLLEGGKGGGAAAQERGSARAAACDAERGGWWEGPSLVLYRGMVHPDTPGLLFLGLESHLSSSPQLAQLQSQWLAALLMNRLHLPPAAAMRADIARQRAWRAAALAHPLMSTHGSLARAQERHYTQQLTADLEGLSEGRKAPGRGGEGWQSRVAELRPGPEHVSAQRQLQLRTGLVAAVESLSGHTSESGSGQHIAPNRSERRRRVSMLRRHLGAAVAAVELPGCGASSTCSSANNYSGSGGYFPMVEVGAATTHPGLAPWGAAAVDSPVRDRRASLPGFRAVRQALTEQLKTTSSRLASLRRRSTGWGDYHNSDSGTAAPPPPPPLSTQSSRKAPGRDVPAGCTAPLVSPATAAAATAAAATVAAAAEPEATAGSAPRKAAPAGLGDAVSRLLPYIGAHTSRCQVPSTEPDEFATGTAAPYTALPPQPSSAAASPASGSGYPASFRLDDAGSGGIGQGPPQHPQTLQQPRQAQHQHQVQGLGLPACMVRQSRDQEAETDPRVGVVAGLRTTEESIMPPLMDGERSRANGAGVEGGAFSRTRGSVGQVPLSGSGERRGALMMHLFTADSAAAAPAEAAVAVALAGCSSKDLTTDGLNGISDDCDDGDGGGGVRSTQAERAGATEEGPAAVVDAGAARLSRPQSPAANSAAEVAPPAPFVNSICQGAQSSAAGADVAEATAAAPAAAAGKACQVALALRASQGRRPASSLLPMVQEAPESACLSHDAVSLNGLLAPGGEEEQEVTRQKGAEEQEKGGSIAAETGGGGCMATSGNTGSESGRPGELRLGAAKVEPLSIPLPLLQSHLVQSGYAGYNAAEGGSGGGGGDVGWGQPSQPLPLVAPPQPQLAGKPGALYNSTPLPLLCGSALRLSGVVPEDEEAEEEGDEVSPWIQVGCEPASPPAASEDGGSAAASCRGSTALTSQSSGPAEMMPQLQSLGRQHYQQQAQQQARSPRPVGRPTGPLQHAAVRPQEAPPPGASASSRGWTLLKRDVPARSTTLLTPASLTAAQVEDAVQGGVAGATGAAAAAATGADGGGAVDVMRSQIAALRAHLLDPASHPFPDILGSGGGGGAAKGPGRSTHRHVTATTSAQHHFGGGSQQLPNMRAAAAAASEPPGASFKTLSGLPTTARPLGRRSVAAVLAAHLGLGLGPKAPRAGGNGKQPPTAIAHRLSPTSESSPTPTAPAADGAYRRATVIALTLPTPPTTATSAPRPLGVTDVGRLPGSGGGSGGSTATGHRPISASGLPLVQGMASVSNGAEGGGQDSGGARVSAGAAMSVDASGGKWPPKTAPAAAAAASEPNVIGLAAAGSSVLSFLKTALMPSPGAPVAGSPSRADGAATAAAAAASNSARSPPGAPGLATRSRLPPVSLPGIEAGDLPSLRSVALTPVTPVAIPAGATTLATGDMQTGARPANAAASPFSPTPTCVAASQGCEAMSTTSVHLTVAAAATAVGTSPTKSLSARPSPSPSPRPGRAGAEAGGLGGSLAMVNTGRTVNVRRNLVMDFFTRGGASSSTAAVPEEGPVATDGPAAAPTGAGAAAATAATGETFQAHGDRHCGAHSHHRRSIDSGQGVNGAIMEYGSGVNGPFSLPIRKLQLPNFEPAHAGFQYPFGPTPYTSSHRPGNDPASSRGGGAGAVDPAISHQGGLNGRSRLMTTCGSPDTAAGPPGSASPRGGRMLAFRSRRATLQAGDDQLGSLLGRAADAAAVPYSKSSQLAKMSLNLHHRGAANSIFDLGGGGGGGGGGVVDRGSSAEGKHISDLAAAMGVHVGGSDTASDDGDSGVGRLDGGAIHDAGACAGIGDVREDGEQCGDGGAMLRALAEANVTVMGAISARSGGDDSGGVHPATPAPTLLASGCDTYTPAKPSTTTSTAAAYTGTTVAYTPQPQKPQRLQRPDVTETPSQEQQHSQEAAVRLRTRPDPTQVLPGSSASLFHRGSEPQPLGLSDGAEAEAAPPPPYPFSRAARPPPGRCSTVMSLEGSGRLMPAMLPEQLAEVEVEVEVEARTAAMALPGRRSPAWVVRRISEAKQEKLVSEVSAWLKEALEKGTRRTSAAGATWSAE